jgi:transcriptional regulator with XRE-family HTH domain/uncharacterized protein YuzE
MKYVYDREADSLSIVFADGRRYRDSEEIHDGIVIDYDTAGRPIAIEFHDRASRFVDTDGLASGREVYVQHPDVADVNQSVKGDWLRGQRELLGLTQQQLADQLSVGKNTIARWEREELKIEHPGMLMLALQALQRAATTRGIEISPGARFFRAVGSISSDQSIARQAKSGAISPDRLSKGLKTTLIEEEVRSSVRGSKERTSRSVPVKKR